MTYSIFQRLGYNFPEATQNTVPELSEQAKKTLGTIPDFMTDWQNYDISNSQASGYTKNPVSNVMITILSDLDTMANACIDYVDISGPEPVNVIIVGLEPVYNASVSSYGSSEAFNEHCDRVSGITRPEDIDVENEPELLEEPFFDTAIGVGKTLLYVTSQTDGISNASPVMGSFTSLFVEDQLLQYSSNIAGYKTLVLNSITTVPSGNSDPDIKTSNLSPSQISTITTGLSNFDSFINTRRTHDSNYFKNAKGILREIERTRLFTTGGESEQALIDLIATPKLQERRSRQDTMSIPKSTTKSSLPANIYNTFTAGDGSSYVIFNQTLDEFTPSDVIVNSDAIVGEGFTPGTYRELYNPTTLEDSGFNQKKLLAIRTGYNKNQYWRVFIPRGTIGVDLKVTGLKETEFGEFILHAAVVRSDMASIDLPDRNLPWVTQKDRNNYNILSFSNVINSNFSYQANLQGSSSYFLSTSNGSIPYLSKGVWLLFKTVKVPGNIIHSIQCEVTVNSDRYSEWYSYIDQNRLWDSSGNPPLFLRPPINFQYN